MPSVLQPWVQELKMMQQTVLITAVRGPDGTEKYSPVKYLQRWYRRCVLLSAMDGKILDDPYQKNGGSFTGPSFRHAEVPEPWEPFMDRILNDYLRQLDMLPHHFRMHFMHAAEIIGYKHPNKRIRNWWLHVYLTLVKDLHLSPETERIMDERLGDDRSTWLAHNNTATVDYDEQAH